MTVAEKIVHRLGIILVIEPSNEVDRVAALLLILIEPQVSAYGDLLTAVVPFILGADLFEGFSLTAEQLDEVSLTRVVLLFVGKAFVFYDRFSLSLSALIGAPAYKNTAPFHSGGKAVPSPVFFAA